LVPAFPKKFGDGAMPCWIIFLRKTRNFGGGKKRKSQAMALCPAGSVFCGKKKKTQAGGITVSIPL
jgi:hypothetical protein